MERLRDAHVGQTAWIVGKGPSLVHLRSEHIGPGPVLTLNHAIIAVGELGLTGPVYSLQNDGLDLPVPEGALRLTNSVFSATSPDIEWDAVELGLGGPLAMVVRVAVHTAKMMGCTRIVMLCCDSVATGDLRTCTHSAPGVCTIEDFRLDEQHAPASACYVNARKALSVELADIDHSFVTPGA